MTRLEAVMVDLDGTLARTAEANRNAYERALREVGVQVSSAEFDARIQGRHWREFLPAMLTKAQVDIDPADVARRKGELYKAAIAEVDINLALVAMLLASRPQMKTALVTSAARRSVEALLDAHGLVTLFDTVVTGDEVTCHKPDPEAYALAARRLGVEPDACLIYEDSDAGVASARAFGGHCLRIVF